jgi:carbamoyltransferase
MIIIGLNSFWEEDGWRCKGGSVSLIIDGKLITSIAEDRVSRNKYEGGYTKALRYILELHNINIEDVDYFCISFYGNHIIPDDYILRFHLHDLHLEEHPEKLILIPSHHLSHAISGYFLSPFEEAIIMVADNEGSILYTGNCNNEGAVGAYCERNSFYYAKGNIVTLLERDFEEPTMVGFGKAYNKFTEYIGLGDYHNGGKTMGLSSYGTIPTELKDVDLWELDEHDHLLSNLKETFDSKRDIEEFLNEHNVTCPSSHDYNTEFGKNLAYYIQSQLNKWACEKLRKLVEKTGIENICISGGELLKME